MVEPAAALTSDWSRALDRPYAAPDPQFPLRPLAPVPFVRLAAIGAAAIGGWGFALVRAGDPRGPWLIGAGVVGYLAMRRMLTRASPMFNRDNAAGQALLGERKGAPAEEEFAKLARRYRWWPALHVVALFNLAAARVLRGDPKGALALLCTVERSGLLKTAEAAQIRDKVALVIALAYAQVGDSNAARSWLAHAQATTKGELVVGNVLAKILMRENRWREAAETLASSWSALERNLPAAVFGTLRIERALALEMSGGETTTITDLLAGCRPFSPGHYIHLGAHWPEMADFLKRHGFDGEPGVA